MSIKQRSLSIILLASKSRADGGIVSLNNIATGSEIAIVISPGSSGCPSTCSI